MEKKLPYLGKKLPYKCYRLPRFKGRPLYLVGVGVRVRVRSRKKVALCGKDHMGMVVFFPFCYPQGVFENKMKNGGVAQMGGVVFTSKSNIKLLFPI